MKSMRRAAENHLMCFSYRGHDFDVVNGASSSVGRRAKDITVRAARRLDREIVRAELAELEAEWHEYLTSYDEEYRAFYEEEWEGYFA